MSIRELKKKIKRTDRKLLANRRIMSRYFNNTVIPFFKSLNTWEIAAGILGIVYLMRNKIKKIFIPAVLYISKKILSSYVIFQITSSTRQQVNRR